MSFAFNLGRNYMNFRLTSWLCGLILIAAGPVMADRMPDTGLKTDSSADIHAVKDLKLTSLSLDTLYISSPGKDAHSFKLTDFGPFEHGYSFSDSGKTWGKEGVSGDSGWGYKKGDTPPAVFVAVPEPGSLLLLLIGLVSIGIFAPRRREMLKVS